MSQRTQEGLWCIAGCCLAVFFGFMLFEALI